MAALVRAGGRDDAIDAVGMGDPLPDPSVLSRSMACPGEGRMSGLCDCGCGCIIDGSPFVLSDIDGKGSAMVRYQCV